MNQREYHAAYYAKNRDALRARSAAYHANNKEIILERKALYRLNNQARLNVKGAIRRAEQPRAVLVHAAKRRAAEINHEFDLTVGCMEWSANCPCCGVELRYGGTGRFVPRSASIDRINSAEGYTQRNSWVICYRCNTIKNSGTPAELRRIADAVDAVIAARAAREF